MLLSPVFVAQIIWDNLQTSLSKGSLHYLLVCSQQSMKASCLDVSSPLFQSQHRMTVTRSHRIEMKMKITSSPLETHWFRWQTVSWMDLLLLSCCSVPGLLGASHLNLPWLLKLLRLRNSSRNLSPGMRSLTPVMTCHWCLGLLNQSSALCQHPDLLSGDLITAPTKSFKVHLSLRKLHAAAYYLFIYLLFPWVCDHIAWHGRDGTFLPGGLENTSNKVSLVAWLTSADKTVIGGETLSHPTMRGCYDTCQARVLVISFSLPWLHSAQPFM